MKKFLAILMAAALATALLAGCSNAAAPAPTVPVEGTTAADDKSLEYITSKGELILGLDDSFAPMGFRDEKDEIAGYDIDLAKEVAKRLGVELKLQPIEWLAKEQELNTKNIDCIWNGFSISDERRQKVEFSNPYLDNNMALVVKKDSGITKLSDMKGKKLALQGGSSAADALDANAELKSAIAEVVEFKDNMLCLMDLETGGVDAVLMDDVVSRYYIATENKNFMIVDENVGTEEYAVGFRKGETALTEAVNKALSDMAKDGTMEKITTKWFGGNISKIK